MYKIENVKQLAENVFEFRIYAPLVVKNCAPGQFIILRVDEEGERVPFTISDYDKDAGTVSIMVQKVGATTEKLCKKVSGEYIQDFVGPLGNATDLSEYKHIVLVGGGIGTAVVFPQAKYLAGIGKDVSIIEGARDKSLILYKEEFSKLTDKFYIMTDNGSMGEQGFVTTKLKELIEKGEKIDVVFAVGPMIMMKVVSELTKEYGIPTVVSMNSIMVDGTGMCGCCRLSIGGVTKYACVDGPEFDGHQIDYAEALNRLTIYKEIEKEHLCRLRGERNE